MDSRHPSISSDQLVTLLDDLRPRIAYPDTVGIADAVNQRVSGEPHGRRAALSTVAGSRRRALVAALVVLALLVSLVVAIPTSRDAVADWLGLRGVRIERSNRPLQHVGSDLQLGRVTTLAAARRAVDLPVTVPRGLGTPTVVYIAAQPSGGRVTLLYTPSETLPPAGRDDVGLLITMFRAELDEGVFRKQLGRESTLEPVTVNGRNGFWISGGPHVVGVTDQDGNFYRDTTRLAQNTLLIQDRKRTIRIESALTKNDSIRIAETLLDS